MSGVHLWRTMSWRSVRAVLSEQFQRFGLGCGDEGKETQIRLRATLLGAAPHQFKFDARLFEDAVNEFFGRHRLLSTDGILL